ncbi:MAG: hypothetical protein GY850_15835 [bacterium]|nr:hypothetical protein [bacterium]
MLPTPEISVILGNFKYDSHVAALQVTRTMLPAANQARILFPAEVSIESAPDDNAEISLNAGDGLVTVLTGIVQSIERGVYQTVVNLTDGGHELGRYRPAATFEKQNAANIARTLASDLNIAVDDAGIDLSIPMFAAHQKRTAAEHIAYLARLSDGFALIDGEGALRVKNWSDGPADAAIKYGRDLIDYSFVKNRSMPSVAPVGNGPSGSADAPEALRPDSTTLPESIPEPGQSVVWQPQLMLRTPAAVQTAQSGLSRELNQRIGNARLVTLLRPDFEPGLTLEVQDIPAGDVSTNWVVMHMVHEVAQRSYSRTVMQAREAAGAGSSLLGSLLSAAGGLL